MPESKKVDEKKRFSFSTTTEELQDVSYDEDAYHVDFYKASEGVKQSRFRSGIFLPKEFVGEVEVRTIQKTIKYDLPFLSNAAHRYLALKDETKPIRYEQGFEATQHEGEFVASVQSIIESFYPRLFKTTLVSEDKEAGHPSFYKVRERLYKALKRRISKKNWIDDRGPAVSEKDVSGRGRDLFGKRWSFEGTPLGDVAKEHGVDDPLPLVFCSEEPDEETLGLDYVPVLSYYEQLVAHEFDLHEEFSRGRTQTSFESGLRTADYFGWQQRVQQKNRAEERKNRHISVGAFRPGEAKTDDPRIEEVRACAVPYLIAEIDGEGAEESFTYAEMLVNHLESAGADLEEIVVSFSGNRSFHIRLPMGMVGNPVYRDTTVAKLTTQNFFERLCSDAEQEATSPLPSDQSLFDVLDKNICSPLNTIRAIGAVHQDTGQHCVGFSGRDFLNASPADIKARSEDYEGYALVQPAEAATVPGLMETLRKASADAERVVSYSKADGTGDNTKENWEPQNGGQSDFTSQGIISALINGVGRGQTYHPAHQGRNDAIFHYSLYLSSNTEMSKGEAWEKVRAWNQRNSPPMGRHPDDGRYELRRTFLNGWKAGK